MSYHKIQKQIDRCRNPEQKKILQDRLAHEKNEQAKGVYAQGYQDFKYQIVSRRSEGKPDDADYKKLKTFFRELMWELQIKQNPQKMVTFKLRTKSFILQNCPSYIPRLIT